MVGRHLLLPVPSHQRLSPLPTAAPPVTHHRPADAPAGELPPVEQDDALSPRVGGSLLIREGRTLHARGEPVLVTDPWVVVVRRDQLTARPAATYGPAALARRPDRLVEGFRHVRGGFLALSQEDPPTITNPLTIMITTGASAGHAPGGRIWGGSSAQIGTRSSPSHLHPASRHPLGRRREAIVHGWSTGVGDPLASGIRGLDRARPRTHASPEHFRHRLAHLFRNHHPWIGHKRQLSPRVMGSLLVREGTTLHARGEPRLF